MSCGCGSKNTNYIPCGCTPLIPSCTSVCGSLTISNSWNIPACNNQATLTIPGITNLIIGVQLYNPTYGFFQITAVNPLTNQVTIINNCLSGNATAGTLVPANTQFLLTAVADATGWASFDPQVHAATGDTMTIIQTGLTGSEYQIDNGKLFYKFDVLFTVGGTPTNTVQWTLPMIIANPLATYQPVFLVGATGVNEIGVNNIAIVTGTLVEGGISRLSGGNFIPWSAGTNRRAVVNGWVKI